MAQIPYTADIKSKKIATDVATRLYLFMQINKLIDGLSILNGSKQNNEDLQNFSEELGKLYTDYMDNRMSAEESAETKKIFDDDNELMETADKIAFADSNNEKISQMRMYTAKKISKTITDYRVLSKGEADSVTLNLTGTLWVVLEKENRKIDAEDLANRIIEGKLDPQEIPLAVNTLQSAKQKIIERMKVDWQTYETADSPNKNIEHFRGYFESILTESKGFHYKTYPETRNVLWCIRDDFAEKDTGSKTIFLKMMGRMLDCGHKQMTSLSSHSSQIYNNNNYKEFMDLIKKQYPDDAENIINNMLEVNASDDIEKARRAAFDKKSREFYGKFLSAILAKKKEQNDAARAYNFDYANYVIKNVADYIAELKKGENKIAANLHLADESKAQSLEKLIDDTADMQIISVHHKIPVASAVPLYILQCKEQNNELHDSAKLQEMFDKLSRICPQAAQNRTAEDIAIIGLALSVFPQESRKDNLAEIYKISDKEKREKMLQVIRNKDAIRELYAEYFPRTPEQIQNIKQDILRYVNNPSNHTLPIGSAVHQNMEPNGSGSISKKDDKIYINIENISRLGTTTTDKINNTTVFAAEYDIANLREVVATMNIKNEKIIKALKEANPLLDKKEPKHQIIKVRFLLNMPEISFIKYMRNMLNTVQRCSPIQTLKAAIGITK